MKLNFIIGSESMNTQVKFLAKFGIYIVFMRLKGNHFLRIMFFNGYFWINYFYMFKNQLSTADWETSMGIKFTSSTTNMIKEIWHQYNGQIHYCFCKSSACYYEETCFYSFCKKQNNCITYLLNYVLHKCQVAKLFTYIMHPI